MTAASEQSICGASPPKVNDTTSIKQDNRRRFPIPLPKVFKSPSLVLEQVAEEQLINEQDKLNNAPHILDSQSQQILAQLFPNIIGTPFYKIKASDAPSQQSPLRVGVVLSGGQAAGGHNVICGIFDYIKSKSSNSTLFGFLGGPHGVYSGEYVELTAEVIDKYRNMGGFDMIKSGRHKIETDEQKQQSMKVCQDLNLNGLVVIGGDDSNTNAAILAEYFKAHGSSTSVIGCPKTIDGDLKNLFVEISFGFDTACKTYSAEIGNVMSEALTDGNKYHFIRLMGRSASLIALECALRTHPNLTFIGEEVEAQKYSLQAIVSMVTDLVEKRYSMNKHYGVVCLPEGLIEFIPEVGVLISEINNIVAAGEFSVEKLTPASQSVFQSLPESTQQQLLLDRDPHGNVQVALIHTEKLIMEMTATELARRQFKGSFSGKCYYFGYEGRSGFPSDFDATYCNALGNVAGTLIQNGVTGCMAILKNMSSGSSVQEWMPAGVPLTKMMNLEHRKGKANVPVIKKFLVDITKPCFKAFEAVRESWKYFDFYCMPGSMQLNEQMPELPYTLTGPPSLDVLAPPEAMKMYSSAAADKNARVTYFEAFSHLKSTLQTKRVSANVSIKVPEIVDPSSVIVFNESNKTEKFINTAQEDTLMALFPETMCAVACGKWGTTQTMFKKGVPAGNTIGVVLVGMAVPGMTSVLSGITEKMIAARGKVYGFFGASGLMNGSFLQLEKNPNLVAMQKNLSSFPLLGRTPETEVMLMSEAGMANVRTVLTSLNIDALVVLGASFMTCCSMSEYLMASGCSTKIISTAGSSDFVSMNPETVCNFLYSQNKGTFPSFSAAMNELADQEKDTCSSCVFFDPQVQKTACQLCGVLGLGFDTQTKVASECIGNLLTDSNSAAKYFYFCRIGGGRGAEAEVAYQVHPNLCLLSALYARMTPAEIASSILSTVSKRSAEKKNFGLVVMNEDFFLTNQPLRTLAMELFRAQGSESGLTAAFKAMLESCGPTFSKLLKQVFNGQGCFYAKAQEFPVMEMLVSMVSAMFKQQGCAGSFSPICFDMVVPIRGSNPSSFDSYYGYFLGLSCGALLASPMTQASQSLLAGGAAVLVKRPQDALQSWKVSVLPLPIVSSASKLSHKAKDENISYQLVMPVFNLVSSSSIPASVVKDMKENPWAIQDTYINSGPIQYSVSSGMPEQFDMQSNYMMSQSIC